MKKIKLKPGKLTVRYLPVSVLMFSSLLLLSTEFFGQQKQKIDLHQYLKDNKLEKTGDTLDPLIDGNRKGVSNKGISWIKGVEFSEGIIEVDIRGKDILQGSFPGIIFHATDTSIYDQVYFRPFNFRAPDSIRRVHSVQYVSYPDFGWQVLRQKFPGKYEKAVTPVPLASDWFHAKIVVKDTTITVYVNGSSTPSLVASKLNQRRKGMIGLASGGSPGDFANLEISK